MVVMPLTIFGVDPGESTGFVVMSFDFDSRDYVVTRAVTLPWGRRFSIGDYLTVFNPDVIVVESFHLYADKARSQIGNYFPSVRVIGIVEAYAHQAQMLDRIVFQSASDIAKVKILARHLNDVILTEHTKDAYKHIRHHLVTKYKALLS